MNKRDAKNTAFDNDKPWSYYLGLIASKRGTAALSVLNKSITKEQALDIFDRALSERNKDEVPKGHSYSVSKRRQTLSRDGLIIHNILRECG